MLLRRLRDVRRASDVHIKRQVTVGFAAIHIGVRCGEDDPLRPGTLDYVSDLLQIANIGVFGAESAQLMARPRK